MTKFIDALKDGAVLADIDCVCEVIRAIEPKTTPFKRDIVFVFYIKTTLKRERLTALHLSVVIVCVLRVDALEKVNVLVCMELCHFLERRLVRPLQH